MICANCGREMTGTDRFCGICGAPNQSFENTMPVPEHTDTQAGEPPVQDFVSGIHSSVTRLQEYTPYTQTDGTPAPEYRPYPPVGMEPPMGKVKRTCSLSAVIFCAVVIFFLSVACGIFAGLYFSARQAAAIAPPPITEYGES